MHRVPAIVERNTNGVVEDNRLVRGCISRFLSPSAISAFSAADSFSDLAAMSAEAAVTGRQDARPATNKI